MNTHSMLKKIIFLGTFLTTVLSGFFVVDIKPVSAACTIEKSWVRAPDGSLVTQAQGGTLVANGLQQRKRYVFAISLTGCSADDQTYAEVGNYNRQGVFTKVKEFPRENVDTSDPTRGFDFTTGSTDIVWAIRVYKANSSFVSGQIGSLNANMNTTPSTTGTPTTPTNPANPANPSTPSNGNPQPGTQTPPSNGSATPAGNDGCNSGAVLCNPLKAENLGQLMLAIMKGFIVLIAAWAVLFIVIGGFRMVISQGNSEALTKAKATITWAVMGVIVSLLAFSIVGIVQNLVGYKGLP